MGYLSSIFHNSPRFSLFCLTVMLSLAAVGCSSQESEKAGSRSTKANPAVPVIVAPVSERTFYDEVEALGTSLANESILVTPVIAERIQKINFEDGQSFRAGETIVQFDDAEERASLKAARARLLEQQRVLARNTSLREKKIVSQAELEAAEATVAGAVAEVELLKSQIADRVIRAPFDGQVGLRNVSMGAFVQPGQVITTLDDLSKVKVDFTLPAEQLGFLREGIDIEALTASYPNRSFAGSLVGISGQVNADSRSITARAIFANSEGLLRPGMLMTLRLRSNERRAMSVPESALIPLAEKQFVFVLEQNASGEGQVRRQQIEIGVRSEGVVEVKIGLEGSDQVVVHGTQKVGDSSKVRVLANLDGSQTVQEILSAEGER